MVAAKKYGPSIIYIDECEKFMPGKKKKKTAEEGAAPATAAPAKGKK